jgi:hypothetical protein
MDINRVAALLHIVKEAAGHPAQLGALGGLAMKELLEHNRDAKVEHDKYLAEQAKAAAAKKLDEAVKAKKIAEDEAKKAELTNKPQQPPLPPGVQVAKDREDRAKQDVALAEARAKKANETKNEPDEAESAGSEEPKIVRRAIPADEYDTNRVD